MTAQPAEGMEGYLPGVRAGLAARNRLYILQTETRPGRPGLSLTHPPCLQPLELMGRNQVWTLDSASHHSTYFQEMVRLAVLDGRSTVPEQGLNPSCTAILLPGSSLSLSPLVCEAG